jgi:O-antigen biosynthesis protein WbqV
MLSELIHRTHWIRIATAAHDMLAAGAALLLSLLLRYGTFSVADFIWQTLWFMILAGLVGGLTGLNGGVWRYASLADVEATLKTATGTVLVFALSLFLFNRLDAIPRSSLVMSWALMILFIAGSRFTYRLLRNRRAVHISEKRPTRNVLLIGAGENAESFLKSVAERTDLPFAVLGIIDERDRRTGLSIRGVRVLGRVEDLDDVMVRLGKRGLEIDALILTKTRTRIGSKMFDQVADAARRHRLGLLRLPEISDLGGDTGADLLKPQPILLEDLLPRRAVDLASDDISRLIKGASVLVTGAGGSIGSELCRKLLRFGPRRIVLVDNSEFLLYSIDTELRRRAGKTEVVALLGDVRQRNEILSLFKEQKPEVVFHAAALKHVPIVEAQPLEGLRTNVLGTRNVADAALAAETRAFVLISTDKAINPTNVMGATKRMAECYCQALDVMARTHFVTVRFGNVLGSAGSVVPLFEKQIKSGGPVTVTHPEIERYFMTIPEAAQLVLHATSHAISESANRGRIFVLDMGQPVKILDVAHKMIRLAGFRPESDIRIEFIGLRPGEKLHEELFAASEGLVSTGVDGVLSATTRRPLDRVALTSLLDTLDQCIEAADAAGAFGILRRLVPEYVGEVAAPTRQGGASPPNLQVISGR